MESVKTAALAELATELKYSTYRAHLKRWFDVSVACVSLVCATPILLLAMLAIALESRGLPIFVQTRIGQRGKLFRIYKLRTMRSGSESLSYKTLPADARLTCVGAALRKLNLDELPQLLNIILGDMSIIGPRPLSLDETKFLIEQASFSEATPGLIPVFRPGLIGLEQVNRSVELTYEKRFEYNNYYESNWSLSLDASVLWKAMQLCVPAWTSVICGALVLAICSLTFNLLR